MDCQNSVPFLVLFDLFWFCLTT